MPEVETVRRGLEPVLAGHAIRRAEVRRPDLRWPLPDRLADRLCGARVLGLRRRSKYLLADLDTGETLIIHLGMSGRLLVSAPDGRVAAGVHDHVVLTTDAGLRVAFNDARRFGSIDLAPTPSVAAHRLLAGLGPEPLGEAFSPAQLAAAFRGRRIAVKAALLDQRTVAGLGNIYACEALHRAGIAPWRRAGRIAAGRIARLVQVIREVLAEAIAAGGSSLRDYRQAGGELGGFQHAFGAYGRAGLACPTPGCGGTIRRMVQSGRSTFWCPTCQR